MKRANSSSQIFRFTLKSLVGILGLSVMLVQPALALEESAVPTIGAVSFVLGKAYVEKQDGTRERIKVGTVINVSDHIETGTNGHVHIRFVDQALFSLRPSSRLEILRYDYRPEAPENSVVKFNLVEGVARTISGEAAKAARKNFRMDTPVAAIGVRGTDFVVSSDQDGVRAQVNEGAIIIAPYSNECSVATFGPCSLNALELVGGANQIAQVDANTDQAMLLSLAAPAVPEVAAAPAITTAAVSATETKNKDDSLYTESVITKPLARGLAIVKNPGTFIPIDPPLTPVSPATPDPAPPAIVEVPEFTPVASVTAEKLKQGQLVWGRWVDPASELERITVSREVARAEGRKIANGGGIYSLYRFEKDGGEVNGSLGELGFKLNQAQAILTANGQSDLMNVTGGTLNIDFSQSRYSTSLQMNHAATGNVAFSDSGRIHSGGYFYSNDSGAPDSLVGAVSLDGTEAGYYFQKILQSGIIEGLTLWGVQP